jgi:hypothetical protein
MPFPIALMLFLVSALLIYSILHSHGWPAADVTTVWAKMTSTARAGVFVCFMANAYGFGVMIDSLFRKKESS